MELQPVPARIVPIFGKPQESEDFYNKTSEISGLNACLCTSLEALSQIALRQSAPDFAMSDRVVDVWTQDGVREYNRVVSIIIDASKDIFTTSSEAEEVSTTIHRRYQLLLRYTAHPLLDSNDLNSAYDRTILEMPMYFEGSREDANEAFYTRFLENVLTATTELSGVLCLIGSSYFVMHVSLETKLFSIYDPHGPVGEKLCGEKKSVYVENLNTKAAADLLSLMYPDLRRVGYFVIDPTIYKTAVKCEKLTKEALDGIVMSLEDFAPPLTHPFSTFYSLLWKETNPLTILPEYTPLAKAFMKTLDTLAGTTTDYGGDFLTTFTALYTPILSESSVHIPSYLRPLLNRLMKGDQTPETLILKIVFFDIFPLFYHNTWTMKALLDIFEQRLKTAINTPSETSNILIGAYEYFFNKLHTLSPSEFDFSDVFDNALIHLDGQDAYHHLASNILLRKFRLKEIYIDPSSEPLSISIGLARLAAGGPA